MRCRFRELTPRDERGGVAAEFAVTLPAIVLVVVLAAGALGVQSQRILLQDAVADASRLIAREDDPGAAAAHISRVVPGAVMSVAAEGETVCVTGTLDARLVGGVAVNVSATSCALGDGR